MISIKPGLGYSLIFFFSWCDIAELKLVRDELNVKLANDQKCYFSL